MVKLFCLTNKKCWNQFWQLQFVQEIYIFLRGHVSFHCIIESSQFFPNFIYFKLAFVCYQWTSRRILSLALWRSLSLTHKVSYGRTDKGILYSELSQICIFPCNKTRHCAYNHRVKITDLKKRYVTIIISLTLDVVPVYTKTAKIMKCKYNLTLIKSKLDLYK